MSGMSAESKALYSVYQRNGDLSDFWKRNLGNLVNCRSFEEVWNHKEIDEPIKIFFRRDTMGFFGLYFIVTEEYARHLMPSLCETVGTRLRGDHVKIRVVSVHIITCEFQYANKQMQLLSSTDVTEEILGTVCKVFKKLWDGRVPIRQIRVHTSKVESDTGRKYNLFDLQKYDRLETLNKTVGRIREKYGEDAVFRTIHNRIIKNGVIFVVMPFFVEKWKVLK